MDKELIIKKTVYAAAKPQGNTQESVAKLQHELSMSIVNKLQKKLQGDRKKMEKKSENTIALANPDFTTTFPSQDRPWANCGEEYAARLVRRRVRLVPL